MTPLAHAAATPQPPLANLTRFTGRDSSEMKYPTKYWWANTPWEFNPDVNHCDDAAVVSCTEEIPSYGGRAKDRLERAQEKGSNVELYLFMRTPENVCLGAFTRRPHCFQRRCSQQVCDQIQLQGQNIDIWDLRHILIYFTMTADY